MNKITSMLLLSGVLVTSVATGQQDPLYSLYINNPLVINPAYTGLNNNFTAAVNFRNQWAAFDGNPTTLAAMGHASLHNNKMGGGMMVITDRIGETSNTNIGFSYAYKIVKGGKTFSFGMQAGAISYQTNPSQLNLQNPDDAAFGRTNETKVNLGAGVILNSDRYMIGFSVPRLMRNSLTTQGGNVQVYQQHFYLLGSSVHFINERVFLKPSVLFRGVKGSPVSADLNFNVNIDRTYTAGAFTRNLKTFGFLAEFTLREKYRLAYVFELPSNGLVGTGFSTHEVMLSLRTAVFNFHSTSISNF